MEQAAPFSNQPTKKPKLLIFLIILSLLLIVGLTAISVSTLHLKWYGFGNNFPDHVTFLGYNNDSKTTSLTEIDASGEFSCTKEQTFSLLGTGYRVTDPRSFSLVDEVYKVSDSVCRLNASTITDTIKSSKDVPEVDFSRFKNLKELEISFYYLKVYPNSFGKLDRLTALYLTHHTSNKITIDPKVWQLKNLQHLNINAYIDGNISQEIGQLVNLRTLGIELTPNNLGDGKFSNVPVTLPADFGNLENLEVLKIGITDSIVFPETISNLKKLTYLDLSRTTL